MSQTIRRVVLKTEDLGANNPDPACYRGLQDYNACEDCPIQLLSGDEKKAKIELKERIQQTLEGIKKRIQDVPEMRGSNGTDQGVSWKKLGEQHLESCHHHKKKTVEPRKENFDLDNVGKLSFLVDIYEQLKRVDFVRRAAFYRRFDEEEAKETYATSKPRRLWYIVFPMILFMFAFAFQSVMLHATTHFYIQYMEDGSKERRKEEGMLFDLVAEGVAYTTSVSRSDRMGAVTKGRQKIEMKLLDASGILPALFWMLMNCYTLANSSFNMGLWNKTFIVASVMAVLKGVCDVVTILPDSIGWKACKSRLTESGIEVLKNSFGFQRGFILGTVEALIAEAAGSNGKRIRYCADMMISGHTYFAVLFALSAYKMIPANPKLFGGVKWNTTVRYIVGFSLTSCIMLELILVSAARFHYTVDMLIALVLVILLYDSAHIEQLAADWSEGFYWADKEKFTQRGTCYWFWKTICQNEKEQHGKVIPWQAHGLQNYRYMSGKAPWEAHHHPHEILPIAEGAQE